MDSDPLRPANRIAFRLPVIVLVLAATVIPVELRPLGCATLSLSFQVYDVLENILGFVPVGIVLGRLGWLRAFAVAVSMSTFAEASQFLMVHRDPSPVDVASNVIGAIMGIVISRHWWTRPPELGINTWKALVAATLALVLVLGIWASSGDALNSRGLSSPGTLEAHWKFDESQGRVALDSSGHGLDGRFRHEPKRVAGVLGGAIKLDGKRDYVDFGHSSAFRLAGSMTISAWINPSSFPADDAAIVSQFHDGFGYQLDTTVDRGPRTIGFKLTNACGHLMARYGVTPLVTGTWYHVAGVYDANARKLDVYLNGKLDDGYLLGWVTSTQHSSRSAVDVGRRSDLEGFQFAGSIDDVRIYSFALTSAEVVAGMGGGVIDRAAIQPPSGRRVNISPRVGQPRDVETRCRCAVSSDPEDARIPGAAAALGFLAAIAFLGLCPSSGLLSRLGISFAAGLLLVPVSAPTLPLFTRWMMPLVSLACGASVAVSVRPREIPDH